MIRSLPRFTRRALFVALAALLPARDLLRHPSGLHRFEGRFGRPRAGPLQHLDGLAGPQRVHRQRVPREPAGRPGRGRGVAEGVPA